MSDVFKAEKVASEKKLPARKSCRRDTKVASFIGVEIQSSHPGSFYCQESKPSIIFILGWICCWNLVPALFGGWGQWSGLCWAIYRYPNRGFPAPSVSGERLRPENDSLGQIQFHLQANNTCSSSIALLRRKILPTTLKQRKLLRRHKILPTALKQKLKES